jgi:hypothetical protein
VQRDTRDVQDTTADGSGSDREGDGGDDDPAVLAQGREVRTGEPAEQRVHLQQQQVRMASRVPHPPDHLLAPMGATAAGVEIDDKVRRVVCPFDLTSVDGGEQDFGARSAHT